MTAYLKIFICLLSFTFGSCSLFAQKDTVYIEKQESTTPKIPDYEPQIKELNKEISDLSRIIGDTKQSFYDSKLSFWNYLLTAIALLFVIVAYIGLRSISQKISDLKYENELAIRKSEKTIKEIKDDLLQRISEIKSDVRDFKNEQNQKLEKFERDANIKIKQGLDTELGKAIDKVMKGTFENVINEIYEQLNNLTARLDSLPKNTETKQPVSNEQNVPIAPMSIEPKTNAFDGE